MGYNGRVYSFLVLHGSRHVVQEGWGDEECSGRLKGVLWCVGEKRGNGKQS